MTERYKCPICKKTFEVAEVQVACAVMHPKGECCHYGTKEIVDTPQEEQYRQQGLQ